MITIALTGGIGAGKSTFARMLVDRGAVLVDADSISRRATEPSGAAFDAVVERFGTEILDASGAIDRAALAAVAFADPAARRDLEDIVHPVVAAEIAKRLAEESGTDHVVVVDIPLLAEVGRGGTTAGTVPGLDGVIVVDVPLDVARLRLVEDRGMDPDDVGARIGAQAGRDERRAAADLVVDNSGSLAELEAEADRAWDWAQGRRR
ncbi:MAG: dephospho-CoA kinase [Actinomycetota bacterium]|nr:dephospho-CoA kinase [Actinomycetota bacterium]